MSKQQCVRRPSWRDLPAERLDPIREDCFVVLDRLRSAADKIPPQHPLFGTLVQLMCEVAEVLDRIPARPSRRDGAARPTGDAAASPHARRRSAA